MYRAIALNHKEVVFYPVVNNTVFIDLDPRQSPVSMMTRESIPDPINTNNCSLSGAVGGVAGVAEGSNQTTGEFLLLHFRVYKKLSFDCCHRLTGS